MAVEMERVFARIVVVYDYLSNLALCKDKRVGICSVDLGVGCHITASQSRVQRRDFGSHVGDIVEEGTAINEIQI